MKLKSILLVISFFLICTPANAMIDGLEAYVDEKGSLHLMWLSVNGDNMQTEIQIEGPVNKNFLTTKSHIRIQDLPDGEYTVSIIQNDVNQLTDIVIDRHHNNSFNRRSSEFLDNFDFVALDDSGYPEMSIQFGAYDTGGDPVLALDGSEFTVYENGEIIPDFDFKSPSTGDITKTADIVVVFDDTSSMSNEIDYLKENIYTFVDALVAKGVQARFRLISYGDDANNAWDWTFDPEVFKENVGSMSAYGGGYPEEDAFEAINTASSFSFRPGTQKVFILFTDAPSYEGTDEYGNPTPTKDEINTLLASEGITLYAVSYDDDQYHGEGSITEESGGKWYPISGDFTELTEDIGSTVGNIYHLTYSTPNTDLDTVDISISHSSGVTLDHTYVRNFPPNIYITVPTDITAGEDAVFTIMADDPDNHGLSVARLFYGEIVDGLFLDWKFVEVTDGLIEGSNFTLTIPGSAITTEGFKYYVSVTDGEGSQSVFPEDPVMVYPDKPIISVDFIDLTEAVDPANLNLIIDFTVSGLEDGETPEFYYYGSATDVFTGVPSKQIYAEGNPLPAVYYINMGENKFRVVFIKTDELKAVRSIKLEVKGKNGTVQSRVLYNKSSFDEYKDALQKYVANKADTIILTNFSKMTNTQDLKNKLKKLVNLTWVVNPMGIPFASGSEKLNMLPVVIDLGDSTVLDGVYSAYQLSVKIEETDSLLADADQFNVADRLDKIKSEVMKKSPYDEPYLIILGATEIPYGQGVNTLTSIYDGFFDITPRAEGEWYDKSSFKSHSELNPIDILYEASSNPPSGYASDSYYRKRGYRTGRLVGNASVISKTIETYINKDGYLLTDRNLMYFGGHDRNDDTDEWIGGAEVGFPLIYTLDQEKYGLLSDWSTLYSLQKPEKGIEAKSIINNIQKRTSALVVMSVHANEKLLDFVDDEKTEFENYLLYAGQRSEFSDIDDISKDLSGFIFLNQGCHAGTGFLNDTFPVQLAEENTSIYVAYNAYGSYYSTGETFGINSVKLGNNEKMLYQFVESIDNLGEKGIIYNALFHGRGYRDIGYDRAKNIDLISRPQFYGIPNYRLGPEPSAAPSRRSIKREAVKRSSSADTFLTKDIQFNETGVTANLTFSIGEDYIYDSQSGELSVQGIDNTDEYNRPVLSWSLPLADGSVLADPSILNEDSVTQTYVNPIVTSVCNSDGCTDETLETVTFDDLFRIDTYIEFDKLYVRFIPIQYKTDTKEARITKTLTVQLDITSPTYIADSDDDGLPDYWEYAYGLDFYNPNDSDGPNGDPDGDNINNLQEFLNFTDPTVDDSENSDTTPPNPPSDLEAVPEEKGVVINLTIDDDTVSVQLFYGNSENNLVSSSSKIEASSSVHLRGLSENTTYFIGARAFDDAGNMSDLSNIISFTTPAGVGPVIPEAPTLVEMTVVVKNPTDADFQHYYLYTGLQADLSDGVATLVYPDEGTETRISLVGYFPESTTKIYFRISAVDENNYEGTATDIMEVELTDYCPDNPDKYESGVCGCDTADTDTDNDGTPDCNDECAGDSMKVSPGICGCGESDIDTDDDGTPNCNDECPYDPEKTEPGIYGCGISDTITTDNCPTDPNKTEPGICGCGVADTDSDGDGIPNCNDDCPYDSTNTCNYTPYIPPPPAVDSDGDGSLDPYDDCPSDPDKTGPGICGCGTPDTDTDNDGTPDCNDNCTNDPNKTEPGEYGCGVSETDPDDDGVPNDSDNCPLDANKTEPGACGCGAEDIDTDGDGTADCLDNCPNDGNKTEPGTCGCGTPATDTDGDGTLDCIDNCPDDPEKTEPGTRGCGISEAAPIANAGEDQSIEEGVAIQLNGMASSDPNGEPLSYRWEQVGGAPVVLSDSTENQPTFVPVVPDGSETMIFALTVRNESGLENTDEVAITIQDNGIDGFDADVLPFICNTGKTMGIKTGPGYLVWFQPSAPAPAEEGNDGPDDQPYGMVKAYLKVDQPGGDAAVTFYFTESAPENSEWYSYMSANGWRRLSDYAAFSENKEEITLILTDGGPADEDGMADGIITLSSGLGVNTTDEDGGDDGGICFISTSAPGFQSEVAGKIMIILLFVGMALTWKKQR